MRRSTQADDICNCAIFAQNCLTMSLSKFKKNCIESDSDSDFENPPKSKRFREFSDVELRNLQDDLDPTNTVKSDAKCERILTAYLEQIGKNVNYLDYSKEELNHTLGKFWFAARPKKEGSEHYTVSSLKHIRYALKRIIFKKNKIDIITNPFFSESEQLFKDACRELKKKGYGSIKHTEEIKPSGSYLRLSKTSLKPFQNLCLLHRISQRFYHKMSPFFH